MINLLPPGRKAALRYAKLNRAALSYLRLTVVAAVVIGGVFAAALWQLGQTTARANRGAAATAATLAQSGAFKAQATDTSQRLAAIKKLSAGKTRFSGLLDDLGNALPSGVAITAIDLTGDDTKPVRISVRAVSYAAVLAARDALAASARISAVDLEAITENDKGFEAEIVFGFKKGQAK